MSRKTDAAEFAKLFAELYAINPDRARLISLLMSVQATHKRTPQRQQASAFLSEVAARMPWVMNEAVMMVQEFEDAYRRAA
jgi:hypothetical protein